MRMFMGYHIAQKGRSASPKNKKPAPIDAGTGFLLVSPLSPLRVFPPSSGKGAQPPDQIVPPLLIKGIALSRSQRHRPLRSLGNSRRIDPARGRFAYSGARSGVTGIP